MNFSTIDDCLHLNKCSFFVLISYLEHQTIVSLLSHSIEFQRKFNQISDLISPARKLLIEDALEGNDFLIFEESVELAINTANDLHNQRLLDEETAKLFVLLIHLTIKELVMYFSKHPKQLSKLEKLPTLETKKEMLLYELNEFPSFKELNEKVFHLLN